MSELASVNYTPSIDSPATDFAYQTSQSAAISIDTPVASSEPARFVLDFSLLAIRRSAKTLALAAAAVESQTRGHDLDIDIVQWADGIATAVVDADD